MSQNSNDFLTTQDLPFSETPPAPTTEALQPESVEAAGWHAAAGRKGAQRIHQLIQEGKLYETEHGLKQGRQRLRQLIEQGKLYEKEHGLWSGRGRRGRRQRQSSSQQLLNLCQALLRLVKPSVRAQLGLMIQALDAEPTPTASGDGSQA
jgi:hypothetical protein